jgi:hypothetical protein
MIVQSMNTSEIQREINNDLLYAQTKAEFLKDKLRRKAIKSSNKTVDFEFIMVQTKINN